MDPLIAEAHARRVGFVFAKQRDISHVVMELWCSRHIDRSAVAPILDEIGELVSGFASFSIQHVRCTAILFSSPVCQACLHPGVDEHLA